jgi:16S rRNA (guanine1207-N2)-methyltransferase
VSDPAPAPDPEGQHYFSGQPDVPSAPVTVPLVLPDFSLTLTTDRGVFSGTRVDAGTKLLLLGAPPLPSGAVDVLDLGCGYGPIAVTLARRAPDARVWAVDVNDRALALCSANAEAAGVGDRVRAVHPDEVPVEVRFAAIWSNPPIRIGKPALHDLLRRWLGRLDAAAHAVLVVQKHLGADSLARWLDSEGWSTHRLDSRAGYRLLTVDAATDPHPDPAAGPEAP